MKKIMRKITIEPENLKILFSAFQKTFLSIL